MKGREWTHSLASSTSRKKDAMGTFWELGLPPDYKAWETWSKKEPVPIPDSKETKGPRD
ncbi:MAG: hypothetical protein HYU04_00025 [Candidatus Wildermuthbacteria bacterium]|nr:hypothetical protein [Candidatus Wildermuthbacteria bacterium]